MANVDRIIARLRQRPPQVDSGELRQVLQEYGWTYDRMRGSHAAFTNAGERTLIIPTVSGRHVKRPYVALVLERLGLQED